MLGLRVALLDTRVISMSAKRLISLTILLLAFASNSAYAWFFFFLPGKVTGAIADAFTGAEGTNCVSSVAKVGDKIKLPDGSVGIVKSLSGESSRCTNSTYPIRALLVPANESTPSGSSNSSSNTSYTPSRSVLANPVVGIDLPNESIVSGSTASTPKAGIDLPDEWESKEVPTNIIEKGYFFYAVNKTIDAGLVVSAVKRHGVADVTGYARAGRLAQMHSLGDAKESDIEELQVNGMQAWRFEVTGKDWTGWSITYLTTYIDVGTEVLGVRTFSPAVGFREQRAALSNLAYGIRTPPAPVVAMPPAPVPVVAIPEKTSEPQGSIATRLGVLNKLYKDGLITEKDFESKKQEILKGL